MKRRHVISILVLSFYTMVVRGKCPNHCSFHGQCVVSDLGRASICECDQGYFGPVRDRDLFEHHFCHHVRRVNRYTHTHTHFDHRIVVCVTVPMLGHGLILRSILTMLIAKPDVRIWDVVILKQETVCAMRDLREVLVNAHCALTVN